MHRDDFFDVVAGPTPDLYGPFWIATTLVFFTAAVGNYAHYAAHRSSISSTGVAGDTAEWFYDINKVVGGNCKRGLRGLPSSLDTLAYI